MPLQYAPDYGTVCCVKACLTEEDVDDKCDGTGQECALRNGNTWVLQISRDVGSSCYQERVYTLCPICIYIFIVSVIWSKAGN